LKLATIIKSVKKTNKNVPNSKVVLGWLNSFGYKTVADDVPEELESKIKSIITEEVRKVVRQKKEQAKEQKIFFYISIGGTPELKNTFKIELSDHLMKKTISPKGCDKYCTVNQIGKPVNWIKLPVIVLNNYLEFDKIKLDINKIPNISRIDTNVFKFDNLSDIGFLQETKALREKISLMVNNNWFGFNYNI